MLGASLQRGLSFCTHISFRRPQLVPSDRKTCFRPAQRARVQVGGTFLAPCGQCWDPVHTKEGHGANPWKRRADPGA